MFALFLFLVCFFLSQSIFQPPELAVSLAKECVNQGCGIHMFVLSQQDVGGAWPGHIPYLTGGALHIYGYLQVYEELQPLQHRNWHKMNRSNPSLTVVK